MSRYQVISDYQLRLVKYMVWEIINKEEWSEKDYKKMQEAINGIISHGYWLVQNEGESVEEERRRFNELSRRY